MGIYSSTERLIPEPLLVGAQQIYMMIFNRFYKRFIWASMLWFAAWPTFYFFKLGEVLGPKAWFWIIGVINYPIVAIAYWLIDGLIGGTRLKPWMVFCLTVALIAAATPFYFQRYGFALGVSLEARFL